MNDANLVLLRHGESLWNLENRFTGWTDVGLTARGEAEAVSAGGAIAAAGILPTVVHTSVLTRALATVHFALTALDRLWLPVQRHWRLNERHYGALQGLDKKETAARHGDEQVQVWRRSYDVPPPPVNADDPRHPSQDPRYRHLAPDALPAAESLADVVERMLPYWYDAIVPDLLRGEVVLVVAHGNSLRALVMHLEAISESAITELNIPTGVPRWYRLDDHLGVSGSGYLGDPEAVAAAAEAVARQGRRG